LPRPSSPPAPSPRPGGPDPPAAFPWPGDRVQKPPPGGQFVSTIPRTHPNPRVIKGFTAAAPAFRAVNPLITRAVPTACSSILQKLGEQCAKRGAGRSNRPDMALLLHVWAEAAHSPGGRATRVPALLKILPTSWRQLPPGGREATSSGKLRRSCGAAVPRCARAGTTQKACPTATDAPPLWSALPPIGGPATPPAGYPGPVLSTAAPTGRPFGSGVSHPGPASRRVDDVGTSWTAGTAHLPAQPTRAPVAPSVHRPPHHPHIQQESHIDIGSPALCVGGGGRWFGRTPLPCLGFGLSDGSIPRGWQRRACVQGIQAGGAVSEHGGRVDGFR
jgi:hypothetical protein